MLSVEFAQTYFLDKSMRRTCLKAELSCNRQFKMVESY